jgi:Fe2+ transport system protein FeoA
VRSVPLAPLRLSALETGAAGVVVAIHDEDRVALADAGLREGSRVTVERRLPAGGPVLVELGAVRIALARVVAGRTLVVPVGPDAAGAPAPSPAAESPPIVRKVP